jgi:hypothetical protein
MHDLTCNGRMRDETDFTQERQDDSDSPSRALQVSQESLRVLAKRYGVYQKAVVK